MQLSAGSKIDRLLEKLDDEFVEPTESSSTERLNEAMGDLTLTKGVRPSTALEEIETLVNSDAHFAGDAHKGAIEIKALFRGLMSRQAALSPAHETALRPLLDKCCRDVDFRAKSVAHWRLQLRVFENELDMKELLAAFEAERDVEHPTEAQ